LGANILMIIFKSEREKQKQIKDVRERERWKERWKDGKRKK
jgi:hypothetical protein